MAALSVTMAAVLMKAQANGGELVRHPGGFWTYKGCLRTGFNNFEWHANTSTVQALVKRGLLEYCEWHSGKNGRFPVRAKTL